MKRKLLALFMAIIMCVSLLPVGAWAEANGTYSDGLTWSVYNSTLTISGTGDMADYSSGVTPWDTCKSHITSVVIGDGITSIGNGAFSDYPWLWEAYLPDSVTYIGADAFANNSFLYYVSMSSDVRTIGQRAFYGTNIKRITIPENVNSIGDMAFGSCGNLKKAVFVGGPPENFGSNVFPEEGFSMYVPESVTAWAESSAYNSTDNTWNGYPIVFYDDIAPSGYCGGDGTGSELVWSITEDGCLIISGNGTMAGGGLDTTYDAPWEIYCDRIKSVVVSDGVQFIPESAFWGFKNLESAVIGKDVKGLGTGAFMRCLNLESVRFRGDAPKIYGTNVFDGVHPGFLIYAPKGNSAWLNDCTYNGGEYYYYWDSVVVKFIDDDEAVCAHNYTEVVIEDTCTNQGFTEYVCTKCGNSYSDNYGAALGHNFGAWITVTAATCTADGIMNTKCSNCTATSTRVIPATGHTYGEWETTVGPTCTLKGSKVKKCTVCKAVVETAEIDMLPHTVVTDSAVEATCTSTGLTQGKHCSVCGTVLVAQEVLPVKHETGDTMLVTPATCTETGLRAKYCSVCHQFVDTEVIPALTHMVVTDEAVSASCLKSGLTEGSHCAVCGEVLTAQEVIPATGHTVVTDPAVAATASATGLTEGSHCSVCGEVLVRQTELPALSSSSHTATATWPGHDEGSHTTLTINANDIMVDLSKTKTASIPVDFIKPESIGYQVANYIDLGFLGRVQDPVNPWSYGTVYPTYNGDPVITLDGKSPDGIDDNESTAHVLHKIPYWDVSDWTFGTYTLSASHSVKTENKDYTAKVTATCTVYCSHSGAKNGEQTCTTSVTCADCGEVLSPAFGHDFENVAAKAPTCTEKGWNAYQVCKKCGESTYVEIPANGHSWGTGVATIPTTCLYGGLITYTCSDCGEIKTDLTDAYGHSPDHEYYCLNDQYCTRCGEKLHDAAGHDYIEHPAKAPTCTDVGWEAYTDCSRCDYTTYVEIPALGHTEVEFVMDIAPSCSQEGRLSKTCPVCNQIYETESIAKLPHIPGPAATCTEPQKCAVCGEVLEKCCPNCGAPLHDGAICSICGDPYVAIR